MEDAEEFTIKKKPVILHLFWATLITSIALAVTFVLIVVLFGVYKRVEAIWAILIIPSVSLALSIFGIYVYHKEAFAFKDGTFTYIKVFKKPQTVKVEEIDYVVIRRLGNYNKVQFVNKKAETPLCFIDDGTALDDGVFLHVLTKLNIPVSMYC